MSMVVPDAIEPVVGWRCFNVIDGLLVSPQKNMPWPPAAKAKATCSSAHWNQEWVLATPAMRAVLEARAEQEGFTAELGQYVKYLMPSGEIEERGVYMPWGMKGRVPPVQGYPPPGKDWVLRVSSTGHSAPHSDCHCGIHIARDIGLALQYRGHAKSTAIGVVKGWGRVIPANRGFRVEFAYPDKIFLFDPPEGNLDVSDYGVPVASVLECDEFIESIGVTWR